ncbi:MAG: hypothetical protein ACW964_17230 [Candidatus Hodarchaeales archaeon]|jgi:hypothetical protein
MKVDENFAIFVSQSTIEWYFGNPDAEFLTFITNFLTGLGNIASEIFEGENSVASIEFDRQQHSGFKSSELIASTEGLPHIMEEQISAVLVGQASVLFAQSISEAKSENDRIKISKHFQNIILDFSPRLINDINVIVSQSSSNFSMLSFQELLMLHYAIRKDTFLTDQRDPEGWVLVSNLSGGELPFSWNVESDVVLAGYLAVIIGFIETLFSGSRPKSLVFGTNVVQRLDFIIGSKYFLAFDSPFSVLCKDSDFIPSFNAISHNVIDDLSLSLKEMIIQETLGYATSIIDIIDFKTLLDSYQVFSKEIYLSRKEKERKMWRKIITNRFFT